MLTRPNAWFLALVDALQIDLVRIGVAQSRRVVGRIDDFLRRRVLLLTVTKGEFREDLLTRIDLWNFALPGLAQRTEDIAPNLDHELENAARRLGRRVGMAKDIRAAFLDFARAGEAKWNANFRDLNAAMGRMATFAPNGRISHEALNTELNRLRAGWKTVAGATAGKSGDEAALLADALGTEGAAALGLF